MSIEDQPTTEICEDTRLYVPDHEGWSAKIKTDWQKEYCFSKNPGEDYFHLLLAGEIYLRWDDEKYCLSCALRRGVITTNRLHWQHQPRKQP